MKYSVLMAAVILSGCGGGDNSNPFQVQNDAIQPTTATNTPAQGQTTQTPEQTPQTPQPSVITPAVTTPAPGPCIDTPPINDGYGWNGISSCQLPIINQPEPAPEPVEPEPVEPAPVVTGIWYCDQGGDSFTWNLNPDRTVVWNDTASIGTWWHLEGNKFGLGYSTGGIAEFSSDGQTLTAGTQSCTRQQPVQVTLSAIAGLQFTCQNDSNHPFYVDLFSDGTSRLTLTQVDLVSPGTWATDGDELTLNGERWTIDTTGDAIALYGYAQTCFSNGSLAGDQLPVN